MPDTDHEGVTVSQLLLVEYTQVKDEQKARIGFRDNLLYATLAAMAAVIAAALQGPVRVGLLLLLPPVCLVLGWTYLVNDQKISEIGRYVSTELTPRLAAVTPLGPQVPGGAVFRGTVFGWEVAHRSDRRRRSRKWFQLFVDLLTFCGASLAALTVFWATGRTSATLLTVSLVECAAVVALATQIAVYADLSIGAQRHRSE
ncbi:hypothetical protein KUF83_16845 [Streptomyces sp. BV286]|uniref:hypothetical protein n=1 Tax=Streptomyces sp. BV286 TaxID=2849672 RepID=UPI001C2E63C0|nr:hypothetical protein [Streptomyces sp. BV286]MBV1938217.1 hypothetical protein [Streptomyces sp. BV286]